MTDNQSDEAYVLTDPIILLAGLNFDKISEFLRYHSCSHVCQAMGISRAREQSEEIRAQSFASSTGESSLLEPGMKIPKNRSFFKFKKKPLK